MEYVPGIDASRWQGAMDWQEIAAGGYRFAIIRATIGDQYTDPQFQANWDGAREAGLLVTAYHVVTPKVPAEVQMARFYEVLDDRISDIPLVLDVERSDGANQDEISRCVRDCLREIEGREARKPIVYTARWYWNRYVLSSPEWQTYDLWVASYTPDPLLPKDWTSWRFWQHSNSGEVSGSGSRSTDLNWFAGTYEDLLAYAGKEQQPPPEPIAPWRMRVVIPKLNVRSGPGRTYKDLGDLHEGDMIEVLALAGKDAWVEFEPGRWAAFSLDDDEPYLEPAP